MIFFQFIGRIEGAPSLSKQYDVTHAVRNVTALMQKIKLVSENLFVLEDWISLKRVDAIKRVADENYHPDKMQELLSSVLSKVDETVGDQRATEQESFDLYKKYREERTEEEHICDAFEKVIARYNLNEKSIKTLTKLLNYLERVLTDYKNYDQSKKQLEKKFLDKVYHNTFFNNKLKKVNTAIKSLVALADKNPKKQTDKKIKAAAEDAEKRILKPLLAGRKNTERNLLLTKLRIANEENYRKFYNKQMKTLEKIDTLLKG